MNVQVTDIGVDPMATLFKHPGMRFPEIAKVTFPATETIAVTVVDAPLVNWAETVRATEIGTLELFVIVRKVTFVS